MPDQYPMESGCGGSFLIEQYLISTCHTGHVDQEVQVMFADRMAVERHDLPVEVGECVVVGVPAAN